MSLTLEQVLAIVKEDEEARKQRNREYQAKFKRERHASMTPEERSEMFKDNYRKYQKADDEMYRKHRARGRRYRTANKIKAVEMFGSACLDCKQSFHFVAYDFHHTDPKEKDRNMGHIFARKWENCLEELNKCVMLCSNCHRIRHWNEKEEELGEY